MALVSSAALSLALSLFMRVCYHVVLGCAHFAFLDTFSVGLFSALKLFPVFFAVILDVEWHFLLRCFPNRFVLLGSMGLLTCTRSGRPLHC